LGKCLPVLEEMVRQEMPLLVSSCCSSSDMHLKVLVYLPSLSVLLHAKIRLYCFCLDNT
jgi:hypothetical protein